jgi:hypothetical protein
MPDRINSGYVSSSGHITSNGHITTVSMGYGMRGYSASMGATMAMGVTGPTGSVAAHSNPVTIPAEITDMTIKVRPHHRVYQNEAADSEFARNRLMVTVPEDQFRYSHEIILSKFVAWLDEHNTKPYMIEPDLVEAGYVISFICEGDMVQFALAFR